MPSQSLLNSAAARVRRLAASVPRFALPQGPAPTAAGGALPVFAYNALDVLSKLALVSGITFSVFQFLVYQQAERVKYTFTYVERYDGEPLLTARRRISDAIRDHEDKIAQLNTARMSPEAASRVKIRLASFLVNDANAGNGIAREIDQVVGFFNGLEVCIGEQLCDAKVADAFLATQAQTLWINFGPYIEGRRKLVANYGLGLEQFAARRPSRPGS